MPLGILQFHLLQLEHRHQALAVRRDGAYAHRYPQGARGQAFQLRTVLADSRHNEAMEHPPHGGEQQPEGEQQSQ
ncbi:hypothetical protein D3C86_1839590 [compost metagenome]